MLHNLFIVMIEPRLGQIWFETISLLYFIYCWTFCILNYSFELFECLNNQKERRRKERKHKVLRECLNIYRFQDDFCFGTQLWGLRIWSPKVCKSNGGWQGSTWYAPFNRRPLVSISTIKSDVARNPWICNRSAWFHLGFGKWHGRLYIPFDKESSHAK